MVLKGAPKAPVAPAGDRSLRTRENHEGPGTLLTKCEEHKGSTAAAHRSVHRQLTTATNVRLLLLN